MHHPREYVQTLPPVDYISIVDLNLGQDSSKLVTVAQDG